MHDAVPAVSRFGNKGFRPAPIAGRKARSGNIIVRRTSKIGRHPVKQRFLYNSGKLLLVPYTKDFRRITRF